MGTQDVPLTRVSVQLPTSPLRGARDASHALSLRVHPPPGRVSSVPPSNLAYHALQKSRYVIGIRDFGCVPAHRHRVECVGVCQNISCMVVTELTSHLDRCWLNA